MGGGPTANTYDVINPATEDKLATIAYGTRDDARSGAGGGSGSDAGWQSLTSDRAAKLKQLADLMRERCDYLAIALTLEQGKPLGESRGEIMASAATFEWFAEEAKRHMGVPYHRGSE